MLQSAQKVEIISEQDIWERFFYIRVQTCFPIITTRDDVVKALQETRKNASFNRVFFFLFIFVIFYPLSTKFKFFPQIASGIVAFEFPEKNFYLLDTDSDSKNVSIKQELAPNEPLLHNQKNHFAKNVLEIAVLIFTDKNPATSFFGIQ